MRFFFVLLIALAAAPLTVQAEKTAPVAPNPVDALKKSLHKVEEPPKGDVKKAAPVVPTWMSLPRAQREKILQSWLAMPETTRPAFPIYRDTMLDQQCKSPTEAPAPRDSLKKAAKL